MRHFIYYLLFSLTLSCSSSDNDLDTIPDTSTEFNVQEDLDYNEILELIGTEKLERAVEVPNPDGSLGRNKNGYFHVRFQINLPSISDYAIVSENELALEKWVSTINYSFDRQLEDGSFELSIPEDLSNSDSFAPPSPGDLASGTAFFTSSLGLSLISLQNSDWYTLSAAASDYKKEIVTLKPNFEKTLDYLIRSKSILMQVDAQAPNRLLFDALGIYTLGKYLHRTDVFIEADEFIAAALAQTDSSQGFFIEGGGWDSSYNAVAVKLALELFLLTDDPDLKARLRDKFVPAMRWQLSRISSNGEISTEGNTRVFDGGESFLGEEKQIDIVKNVKALYYFGHLTDRPDIVSLGDQVLEFYE